MTRPPPDERSLELALAVAEAPCSVDELADTGHWRPSTLWAALERLRRERRITADEEAPGRFRWTDAPSRDALLAAATGEALSPLLASRPLLQRLLQGARESAQRRAFRQAVPLFQALTATPDRTLFPGGEAGWISVVVECIRLFRSQWGVAPEILEAATAAAEARGDLRSQVPLLAARGLQLLGTDEPRAHELYRRAREAAQAAGAPELEVEATGYVAFSLIFAGRFAEGITAAEQLLGNVPEDLDAPRFAPLLGLDGTTPGVPLAILATGYISIGDFPRARDLLNRLVALGEQLGNDALSAQGWLFLAFVNLQTGAAERAAPLAAAALDYWRTRGSEPLYTWFAAMAAAGAAAAAGRLSDAARILGDGAPAYRASGEAPIGWTSTLGTFDGLDAGGVRVEGFDLPAMLDRLVSIPAPHLAGIGHRFLARRLLRSGGADARAAARRHLDEAVRLLTAAGTLHELHLALLDAATLAEGDGRHEECAALRARAADAWRAPTSEPGMERERLVRATSALLDLGAIDALAERGDAVWGEVASRLGRAFGAERCALVEMGAAGPSLLAARGDARWPEALLGVLRGREPEPLLAAPALPDPGATAEPGQLALAPFESRRLARRGWIALESVHAPAPLGPGDGPMLAAIGRQVGILLDNVAVWQELLAARRRLEQENRYFREVSSAAPAAGGRILGGSAPMREVLGLVARVAPSSTPVLVTGETGVGKELVSKEIHLLSPRREGPFIAVHVASLAPGLVASALFGHERGAFTGATEQARGRFELADGGTLFLDEVGELSPEDQVRLLRVLQEGTFERVGGTRVLRSDFRLVAATHRDLEAEVRAGRFREDLWYRLSAFPIRVPPLRERTEEIPRLALYFMEAAARDRGVRFEGIGEADMARLTGYPWPGNVRELQHVIARAALLSDPPRLRLPPLDSRASAAPAPPEPAPSDEWITLEESERRYVRRVLRHAGGRVSGPGGAAELLGLKPTSLQFRIDKLGLRAELARARSGRR
jgi:DNA-binding NtrC family response regulator